MKPWKQFEKDIFTQTLDQGIPIVKIPDSCRVVKGFVVRKKTEFDFAASIGGLAVFFDAKYEGKAGKFNFKSRVLGPKKIHQWDKLRSFREMGAVAGYLIHLSKIGRIIWASVQTVNAALLRGEKSLDDETLGVTSQPDTAPLDIKLLMRIDIERAKESINGTTQSLLPTNG